MDTDVKLISGGIYKTNFSEEPIRILRFDDIEVFYDSYWSSLNKWSLASSLKRSGAYYRLPTDFFLKNTTFLRHQPLTIEEINTFRPDLPNRLCRNKQMYWTDKVFDTLDDYKSYAAQFGC
ncbi:MAG: hypothetical protein Q8935_24870, partial [Bacillota bacterium]|nr:hypothetical protein [Bacillota bacterium]